MQLRYQMVLRTLLLTGTEFEMKVGDDIKAWKKDFETKWNSCEKQKDPLKCAVKLLSNIILSETATDKDNGKVIDACTDYFSESFEPLYINENKKKGGLRMKGLFIAGLAIVGISLIFIYQKKYNNDQKENPPEIERKEKIEKVDNVYKPSHTPNQNVLILVLRAGNESCLNTLKENMRLSEEVCDELYKATRYLWVGNANQFNNSKIINWFDESNNQTQASSLDVYLIKLALEKNYSGLLQAADGQARLSAFKQLCQDGAKIEEFSPRVSNAAYGTTEVYEK